MLSTSMLARTTRLRDDDDSLNTLAYRRIKEKIIALELRPASLIDENQLAQDLQIGLTPIRQALRRLAQDKLVVILPRRGTIVADLNPADLTKIFEIRVELEALSAQRAAERISPDQLAQMAALAEEMKATLTHGDPRALIELDQQFHMLVAQAAHNEFLEETISWLYSHVLRMWNLSLHRVQVLSTAVSEHIYIYEAIRDKESQRAAELMRQHVQHFQKEFSKL